MEFELRTISEKGVMRLTVGKFVTLMDMGKN